MPRAEYKNEDEFRKEFIAPFLAKLGFINVNNTHGSHEQGKDFFFTDYDRFGHSRIYCAQVKLGNIGSGSREIDDLLDQIKRCFQVRLRFYKNAHEQRVSAVYVMTSGTISQTARERIHDWCSLQNFGENVYFLDGEQLHNKHRYIDYTSDQERLSHLQGLYLELVRTSHNLQRQKELLAAGNPTFAPCRTSLLEDEIRRFDLVHDADHYQRIDKFWYLLNCFMHFQTIAPQVRWEQAEFTTFLSATQQAIELCENLQEYCLREVRQVTERYTIELESIITPAV